MILGIHGLKTDIEKYNFWPILKEEYGDKINIPQLPNANETKYEDWKKEFDKINFTDYETILVHSMGCRMFFEYIVLNKISVNKVLFLAPAFSSYTAKKDKNTGLIKKRNELDYTYKTLNSYFLTKEKVNTFSNLVNNLLIFHSREDYRISHLGIRFFLKNFSNKKTNVIHKKEFGHFLGKYDHKYFKNEL